MATYRFLDFELNESDFCLTRRGKRIALEPKALRVLIALASRAGHLVEKQELLESVWPNTFVEENTLTRTIGILRRTLGDSSRDSRVIETVPTRGYRFVAPLVEIAPGTDPPSPAASEDSPKDKIASVMPMDQPILPATSTGRFAFVRSPVFLGLALLILASCGLVFYKSNAAKHATRPAIKSLVVLPLQNLSGDPTQQYLADGITEELIGRLSGIHDLRVISRTSVMRFKDTKLPVQEIAKTLGVDALVEGSVIREGSRIRVHAQLIRAATDEHFWSETYDRDVGGVLPLESDVAEAVARKVEVTVTGEEHSRLIATRQVSPEVYESYLKGRLTKTNTRAEVDQSIAYYQDAIRQDPTFAPAYVGLAASYDSLGGNFRGVPPSEVRPKVLKAVQKALELDPENAEAHALLAKVYVEQWKWDAAQAEYKRALDLNPNSSTAQLGFANWLMCQGHMDEALEWSRRARQVDPLAVPGNSAALILFNARRYDEAIREVRSVLAVHPDHAPTLWLLGFVLIANHQAPDAIPVLEKAASVSERSPGVVGLLVHAYASAGRRADALHCLNELKKRQKTSYVPPAAFVDAYTGLGEHDQALAWFERAYEEQAGFLQWIKVFPMWDPLRGDPRFTDLLHRVGLDEPR